MRQNIKRRKTCLLRQGEETSCRPIDGYIPTFGGRNRGNPMNIPRHGVRSPSWDFDQDLWNSREELRILVRLLHLVLTRNSQYKRNAHFSLRVNTTCDDTTARYKKKKDGWGTIIRGIQAPKKWLQILLKLQLRFNCTRHVPVPRVSSERQNWSKRGN